MSRYLALDVGDERIGVAVSDEMAVVARPYGVIQRVAGPASYQQLAEIVRLENVATIVVGLPVREDRSRGKQVASVEAYVRGMARYISVPVIYWDERYTTLEAREIMQSRRHALRGTGDVDAVAAAVILQDYLNQQMEERS
jgi:putative holliday junction resolvase